ncbi:cofactor assembly of complex C subunit B [Pantanalinema rosaneae CENA516]|uniref:cofactor assembly of complex C subunit B n=1 Tax=Pantanalinema rosaneae TaxID=1620701 RepID=UPI003D6FD105
MSNPILSSTFFLTLLLAIGLFFFIRASVKDRTQLVTLASEQPESSLVEQLQQYFAQRAYHVTAVNADQTQVTFEGQVRPSWFLAIFLSLLAAIGILCLVLVLSILSPGWSVGLWFLVLLAPLAGVFYWRGASRPEQVRLTVEPTTDASTEAQSRITVTAHRDEILALQRLLALKPVDQPSLH